MSLDMCLQARFYFPVTIQRGASPELTKTFYHPVIDSALDTMGLTEPIRAELDISDPDFNGSYLGIRCGYWRKANAIHAWFIRNQRQDDRQPVDACIDDLKALRVVCSRILEADNDSEQIELALHLLPPRAGHFFGPTNLLDPDNWSWYLETLRRTIRIVDKAIALDHWVNRRNDSLEITSGDRYDVDFEYRASW
jgi:hypothetical protein